MRLWVHQTTNPLRTPVINLMKANKATISEFIIIPWTQEFWHLVLWTFYNCFWHLICLLHSPFIILLSFCLPFPQHLCFKLQHNIFWIPFVLVAKLDFLPVAMGTIFTPIVAPNNKNDKVRYVLVASQPDYCTLFKNYSLLTNCFFLFFSKPPSSQWLEISCVCNTPLLTFFHMHCVQCSIFLRS